MISISRSSSGIPGRQWLARSIAVISLLRGFLRLVETTLLTLESGSGEHWRLWGRTWLIVGALCGIFQGNGFLQNFYRSLNVKLPSKVILKPSELVEKASLLSRVHVYKSLAFFPVLDNILMFLRLFGAKPSRHECNRRKASWSGTY